MYNIVHLKLNANLEMTQRMQSEMENSEKKWQCGNKIQYPITILYPVLISFPMPKDGVVTLIHM